MNNIIPNINSEYQDAFIWACKENKLEIVILLLSTGKVEYIDSVGTENIHPHNRPMSALIMACKHNNTNVVRKCVLLDTGNAHPEYQNTKGESALMWACYQVNTEIVRKMRIISYW